MGKLLTAALIFSVLTANAQQTSPIKSDEEYLAELKLANAGYHVSTMYGGNAYFWPALETKLEGMLSAEERATEAVSKPIREQVALACFLEMAALEIWNTRKIPFVKRKPPVANMAELKRRTFDLQSLKGVNAPAMLGKITGSRGLSPWIGYGKFRYSVNGHANWKTSFSEISLKAPEPDLEITSDPYWAYFGAGTQSVSTTDRFPTPEKTNERKDFGEFDLDKDGVIRIDLIEVGTSFIFELKIKSSSEFNMDVRTDQGTLNVKAPGNQIWNFTGSRDPNPLRKKTVEAREDSSFRIILGRRKIPNFSELSKPTTAQIIFWKGDPDSVPRPENASLRIDG